MGFNTTVLVLNDRLQEIENDPEFGKKLCAAIRAHSIRDHRTMPYITGQTQIIDCQHADTVQVIAVGANCGRTIGYSYWRATDDEIIKTLNAERLRKAKEARAAKERGEATSTPES